MVKVGDAIEVRSKSKELAVLKEATESAERDVPDYIDVDHSKYTGQLKRVPGLKDIPYPVQMEPNLVIEFYSR
jgi:small subunit ribosomal protein S4